MTDPRGIVDFFALEAGECLERMDAWLAGAASAAFGGPPDAEPFVRSARALRGAATMARQPDLASLAESLGRVAAAVQLGRLPWNASSAEALSAAVEAFRRLLRAARAWSANDAAEAHARAERLETLLGAGGQPAAGAPLGSAIVPIRTLASDDADFVVHRAPSPPITADQRFRQAAVPLASALRRAIAEARRSTARDDAARLTLGEDLRAALRDLRDLAESYDVRPVVNFCAAREAPLAALDDRALETVDGAAAALIESAGATWARATPSSGVSAVEPTPVPARSPDAAPVAAPVAAPAPKLLTPPTPVPAIATPPEPRLAVSAPTGARAAAAGGGRPASGAALVALLETGLSEMAGVSATLAGTATGAPATAEPTGAADVTTDVVPVERLVYRGRAALERALAVRDLLRAGPSAPDPVLLDELYALLDLAALD
jgi:chemotaxis protein histidine kinase CheA